MDEVFKAINDPSRRLLLDALLEHDGQTVGELVGLLPEMTRYGVMNHLRVLEEADLLSTVRQGRTKLHYLNPVPIRLIHDRWIGKYAALRVATLAGIKARVESGMNMGSPDHIYKAYIRGTKADVWDAIVNPDKTVRYFYGTRIDSTWEVGGPLNYLHGDTDEYASTGEIIAIDAPNRLEFTFQAMWDPELLAEGPAREVWALAEVNGMVELRIELYDTPVGSKTYGDFTNGFAYIVSGLKSLVETGEALPAPH